MLEKIYIYNKVNSIRTEDRRQKTEDRNRLSAFYYEVKIS